MQSKVLASITVTSILFPISICMGQDDQNEPVAKTIIKAVKASKKSSSFVVPSWIQDENATFLDVFGEVAKDVLTNKIIPETSPFCDWNWMHLRCEPFCNCSYQPLWGDYHLGRSCRFREGGYGTNHEKDHYSSLFLETCSGPPKTIFYKGMKAVRDGLEFVWARINWRLRLETTKSKMCESLVQVGEGYMEEDDSSSGDSQHYLLEKPVRALRKSLKCNSRTNPISNNPSYEPDGENLIDINIRILDDAESSVAQTDYIITDEEFHSDL